MKLKMLHKMQHFKRPTEPRSTLAQTYASPYANPSADRSVSSYRQIYALEATGRNQPLSTKRFSRFRAVRKLTDSCSATSLGRTEPPRCQASRSTSYSTGDAEPAELPDGFLSK